MTTTTLKQKFARVLLAGLSLFLFIGTGESQLATNTSGGRFLRGSGTNQNYMSVVIPLSFQKGVSLPLMDFQILGTNYFPWNSTNGVLYHYNATNAASQMGTAGRLPYNQTIAAFGSRAGGSALYFNQPYSFGIYAGQPITWTNDLRIQVYRKSDSALVGTINISIPDSDFNAAEWPTFLTNGYTKTVTGFGLTTTLKFDYPLETWGIVIAGSFHLIHEADSSAAPYVFQVETSGFTDKGNMVLNNIPIAWYSRLYTVEFEARPAWRSVFVDQPQFEGKPMPFGYEGKTVDELLTNPPPVTNIVSLPNAPATYTNLDQSPELRRHPMLDQFVSDMRNDPIALTAYVHNEIDLVDALAMNDNGPITDQSVNLGGVNRSALTTFLSAQGSPAEQCALLVYLLRQAGYPAVYMYAPEDKLQMLDTRLNKILKMQTKGAMEQLTGNLYTTNRLISVNYPWVATYVSNQWVHVFPWIKDTEIVEGLNLWDVMPTNYTSGYKWVLDYVKGNTNLLSLTAENSPAAIFPAYLKQTLLQNNPGISVDDIGVKIVNRRHSYSSWSDFPKPTYVTNFSYAVESFSDPAITNVSPGLTNIFDLVNIRVYSLSNTNRQILTGDLRMVDVFNRKFILRFERITSTTHRMILSLGAYRTNVTGIGAFTNDSSLLKQQISTNSAIASGDDNITIQVTYKRHRALMTSGLTGFLEAYEPDNLFVNQATIRKGDLAALCFDLGKVSKKMLQVHAQEYLNMEQQLKSNPSLTNSISPDVYQGTAAYLMGMSYYEKIGRFRQFNNRLQKATILTMYSFGLSKLSAQRTGGSLPSGNIDLIEPQVDMTSAELVYMGNRSLHPDSGEDTWTRENDLALLEIANNSAQEHEIINSYFSQADAISTVKLLQFAQARATNGRPSILILTKTNYLNYGNSNYNGTLLKNTDTSLWHDITNTFATVAETDFVQYLTTPGVVTNNSGSYKGMGALFIRIPWAYGAFISPNQLNGGAGENFPAGTFGTGNMLNLQINVDSLGNYYMTYVNSATTRTITLDSPANFLTDSVAANANSGLYALTDFQNLYGNYAGNLINGSSSPFGNALLLQDQVGLQGQSSDHRTVGQYVSDPVDMVTGEFYVDATDLALPGPMPLAFRRNYSSQNVAANQFGIGWKLSYMPFLTVNNDASIIYASEPDGSVVAYQNVSTNLWVPNTTRNPNLNTHTTTGIGSTANLFNGKIIKTQSGTNTFYTLYSPNGSQRVFQVITFSGAVTSTRPYLIKWQDDRGNFYTCEYGTDSTQPDFGQVRRIQSSNGNFLGIYYDVYGHITEAYTGDGRRLYYAYDEFGDMITVTLPDTSEINYSYEHKTMSVTNGTAITQQPYSTHLLIQELKPDGRELDNQYDAQRRVTNQLSTAGQDLTPIRNVGFSFSNNYAFTNSFTNTITGFTIITDANNNTSRYDYASGLITNITDQLAQTLQQTWYPDNATAPGYPRSLWKRKDLRGLLTEFQYDLAGNITNTIVTGDLTGNGNTNEVAITSAVYTTNNLPQKITDPATNIVQYVYDPAYPFLAQQIIRLAGSTSVSTNLMVYGNVTNVINNGSMVVTNAVFGVMQREIRAYGSPDAATNDYVCDGRGFVTQQTRYSGTTDPDVVLTNVFNARGELIRQTDTSNRSIHFENDALGRPIAKELFDENGNIVEWVYYYYNPNGELVWTDGPHFNPEDYHWRDYDGAGRTIQEIRWRVRAKSDGSGVEAEAGDNLYATAFNQFDSFGNLTKAIDPRQNYSLMDYDPLGRPTRRRAYDSSNVLLKTEGFSYEPGGQIATATNALNGVTMTLYTSTGKPRLRSNPDGITNQWRYYLDGRPAQEILPNGAYWQFTHDDANRRVTREFFNGGFALNPKEIKQLDRRGNITTLTDVDNNIFNMTYDGLDRPKTTTGPSASPVTDQQTTTNIYDGSGKVLTVVNALGEKTITTSDIAGRPVSVEVRDNANISVRKTTTTYSLDHYSATITQGTSNSIVSTAFTDTYGKPVLTQSFPTNGITERTLNAYDLVGNLLRTVESSIQGSSVTMYSSNAFTYDGLNRPRTEVRNGTETTTFTFDPANNITNRAMPGPLTWIANFDVASRMTHEELRGADNVARRSFNYSYYSSGTNVGLLQTITDPRSTTFTYVYDGFRRLKNKSSSGAASEQNMSTDYQYNNRGHVLSLFQTTGGQPNTTIARTIDAYSQLTEEQVYINGLLARDMLQRWNGAARRKELSAAPSLQQGQGAGRDILFGYRADGLMTSLNPGGTAYSFSFADNGLLTGRSNPFRSESISLRDGTGRILSKNQTVSGGSQLQETMMWRPDGKLTNYVGIEPTFSDARTYAYNFSQMNRLTNETLALRPGDFLSAHAYTFDFGASGGPGVRTLAQLPDGGTYIAAYFWGLSANNSTYIDPLRRIIRENDYYLARRASAGTAADAAYLTSTINGRDSKNVDYDLVSGKWRTILEMPYVDGFLNEPHVMRAFHPSGTVTAVKTNQYSMNASDHWENAYDLFGNETQHLLKSVGASVLFSQTNTWDAEGRLIKIANRDNVSDGYDWTALYDGLGRRLRTVYMPIMGGTRPYSLTLDSWYDPQVQYLEIAVEINGGQRTWKIYGPDVSQGYAMQGLGGLESTIREYDGYSIGILSDIFGNGIATITNGVTKFGKRVNSYGPLVAQPLPLLSPAVSVAESTIWRGKRMDPTGFFYCGARYYDPNAGRFISPDPLGHAASIDLYAAFGGDSINNFDPDGRLFKSVWTGLQNFGNRWGDMQAQSIQDQTATSFQLGLNAGDVSLRARADGASRLEAGYEGFSYLGGSFLGVTPMYEGYSRYDIPGMVSLTPAEGNFRLAVGTVSLALNGRAIQLGGASAYGSLEASVNRSLTFDAGFGPENMGSIPNNTGPVVINPPPNATPAQLQQVQAYVNGANQALDAGLLNNGRVPTAGTLRQQANQAAIAERARAAAAGSAYQGQAGHVPDTTWMGTPRPYSWLDLDPRVNLSIGGQANRYPFGFVPTEFELGTVPLLGPPH
jgi:RHS repeat-associated protein